MIACMHDTGGSVDSSRAGHLAVGCLCLLSCAVLMIADRRCYDVRRVTVTSEYHVDRPTSAD